MRRYSDFEEIGRKYLSRSILVVTIDFRLGVLGNKFTLKCINLLKLSPQMANRILPAIWPIGTRPKHFDGFNPIWPHLAAIQSKSLFLVTVPGQWPLAL
jgi:hypothetical protein